MKIKSDFITNSSSSSFLVVFDKQPYSVEEMKKVLFGEREEFEHPYDENAYWKTQYVAERVLNDTLPATYDDIYIFFFDLYDEEIYNACEPSDNNHYFDFKKYNQLKSESAKKSAEEFIEAHKGSFVSIYEFSDNDGIFGSALEHGGLFRNLENIRRSNH